MYSSIYYSYSLLIKSIYSSYIFLFTVSLKAQYILFSARPPTLV